jgi:hypothetical protein
VKVQKVIRKRLDQETENVSIAGELNVVISAQINEPEPPEDPRVPEVQANHEEEES